MANTKSAKKAIRVNQRKRQINIPVISKIRTVQKKARLAVEKATAKNSAENIADAKTAIMDFEKEVKKGVTKNIIKLNTASRRVSRLFSNLKKAQNQNTQKATKEVAVSKVTKEEKAS